LPLSYHIQCSTPPLSQAPPYPNQPLGHQIKTNNSIVKNMRQKEKKKEIDQPKQFKDDQPNKQLKEEENQL